MFWINLQIVLYIFFVCDSQGIISASEIRLTNLSKEWFCVCVFVEILPGGIKKEIFLDGFHLDFVYKILSSLFSFMKHHFNCTHNDFL